MSLSTLRPLQNLPIDNPLEGKLEILGDIYSISSIRTPFHGTTDAKLLNDMDPRFSQRMWTHDFNKFVALMGADVDPYEHGTYQARTVGIPMVDAQLANPDAAQLTSPIPKDNPWHYYIAHHVIHDDHEGYDAILRKARSDTSDFDSTAFTKKLERYRQIEVIGRTYTRDKAEVLYVHMEHQLNEGVFDGQFFRAGEIIGYLSTGPQMAELAHRMSDLSETEQSLTLYHAHGLVGRALMNLQQYRSKVVYVDEFISQHEDRFTELSKSVGINREDLEGDHQPLAIQGAISPLLHETEKLVREFNERIAA